MVREKKVRRLSRRKLGSGPRGVPEKNGEECQGLRHQGSRRKTAINPRLLLGTSWPDIGLGKGNKSSFGLGANIKLGNGPWEVGKEAKV